MSEYRGQSARRTNMYQLTVIIRLLTHIGLVLADHNYRNPTDASPAKTRHRGHVPQAGASVWRGVIGIHHTTTPPYV